MPQTTISQKTCNRCGHAWFPQAPGEPRRCPRCRSPYWNKARVRKDWPKAKMAKKRARKV
jgi:predicted Zn-ribbon and HTH transcriptional regulator